MARPALFWASVAVVTAGAVASPLLPDGHIPVVFFERLLCGAAGALVLAAAVFRPLTGNT
ncbi:hypothetical protein [Streptomyces sp. NPDC047043]|uniref:hypothetical protein n=1 Tax=Streptomyces sp. NPDC047043 TaxID=3154497 RepID=UPI0033C3794E